MLYTGGNFLQYSKNQNVNCPQGSVVKTNHCCINLRNFRNIGSNGVKYKHFYISNFNIMYVIYFDNVYICNFF